MISFKYTVHFTQKSTGPKNLKNQNGVAMVKRSIEAQNSRSSIFPLYIVFNNLTMNAKINLFIIYSYKFIFTFMIFITDTIHMNTEINFYHRNRFFFFNITQITY